MTITVTRLPSGTYVAFTDKDERSGFGKSVDAAVAELLEQRRGRK